MKYHTKVAGVTFEGRQEVIKNLKSGTPLVFERDPENKYDPNAVKVIAEGNHIGFLPRGNWVCGEMDKGTKFNAVISQITGGGVGMSYGVNVEFEVAKPDGSSPSPTPATPSSSFVSPKPSSKKPETETMRLWKLVK